MATLPLLSIVVSMVHGDMLYMSCHDNPNIIAFNVNSSELVTTELLDISDIDWISSDDLHLRGIAISDNILYVANSKKSASFIGKWQCKNQNGALPDTKGLKFIANFTGLDSSNPGLIHPYGMRWDEDNLYVTTQNTQSLLLYDSNGQPVTSTPNPQYPGAIVTFGPYNANGNGVRDVAIDPINNLVFVAEEELQMVLAYDISDNYANVFNITYGDKAEPIGLRINSEFYPNTIFIGDNGYDAIYAYSYDAKKKSVEQLFKTKSISELKHPAGIDVNEKYLFVVAQDNDYILQFEAKTGKYVGKFIDYGKLKITGENLLYVKGDGCQEG